MASTGRGGQAREHAVSRLPQRKREHHPAESATSHKPPSHSTEVSAAAAPISATNPTGTLDHLQTNPPFHLFLHTGPKLTPEDLSTLSRILEPSNHAGAALTFLVRHVLGRDRVARVRAVLAGLQRSQNPSSAALFSPSTFQTYTMAQKKLTRTRALVAARNKELEGLIQEGDASNENLASSKRTFATILAREYVLRTLREKEEVRAARIKALGDLVDKCGRDIHGTHENPANPTVILDTALEAIRTRLPYEIAGSHPRPNATAPISSDLIRAATSPPALHLLSGRVEEARKEGLTLLNARQNGHQAAVGMEGEELVDDVLCFIRERYNVLKRLGRMRGVPSGSTNTSSPIESAATGPEKSGSTIADSGTKADSRNIETTLTALEAAIEVAIETGQGRGIPGDKRVANAETQVSEIRWVVVSSMLFIGRYCVLCGFFCALC
ncbi:hypothetical protein JB92DRAFT_1146635 [Gautieria morchelliformis]|nr:hypothetical protein JB92DRAFT_1146635 [Gautieria morchelliformis]